MSPLRENNIPKYCTIMHPVPAGLRHHRAHSTYDSVRDAGQKKKPYPEVWLHITCY